MSNAITSDLDITNKYATAKKKKSHCEVLTFLTCIASLPLPCPYLQCQQLFNWVEGSEWFTILIISPPHFLPLPVYILWMIIIINLLLTLLSLPLSFPFNYTSTLVKLNCIPSLHLCPKSWVFLEKIDNCINWSFPKFMTTNFRRNFTSVQKSCCLFHYLRQVLDLSLQITKTPSPLQLMNSLHSLLRKE